MESKPEETPKHQFTPLQTSVSGQINISRNMNLPQFNITGDKRMSGGLKYLDNYVYSEPNTINFPVQNNFAHFNHSAYESDNENFKFSRPRFAQENNEGLTQQQVQSKFEIKNYLKEVKSKINTVKFKEFIKNVKLLTNKTPYIDKKNVVNRVKIIFGEEHRDLYEKFEHILGIR